MEVQNAGKRVPTPKSMAINARHVCPRYINDVYPVQHCYRTGFVQDVAEAFQHWLRHCGQRHGRQIRVAQRKHARKEVKSPPIVRPANPNLERVCRHRRTDARGNPVRLLNCEIERWRLCCENA